ncbi:hypothetical protein I302_100235 [Kwoniella bestiolae CBS 10118]|uniref:Asteroid domain-containing protein n=1 Tax=Kwoniella bestiolae CBS 10118 TaxID=1296100 RepID=A0A1B9G4J2_9TREE|nr:hypothetical protein I302_03609 [Kwoniella bestiolae CBS 10118]OCF25933.1 hypothetical protein I302_03609 [Kwoniella bestiolae CBS 10118]
MGVRGLESFIRENRTSLTKTLSLPTLDDNSASGSSDGKTPIIVDAWGVIFKLYLDTLPWTSGGEYLRYYKLVKKLIIAWRKVGLEPTFVFDGAAPPEKHQTILSRASEKLLSCQLFYTTSVPSRSSSSFSKNKVVLPFFASHTFIYALHRLNVQTHFVPFGEADGVCVSMAEKVGGYVFGRDSDFVILIARTERVKGYVPIDMLNWIEGQDTTNTNTYKPPGARQADTFQPVHNGRSRNFSGSGSTPNHMNRQSSLIPSSSLKNPTLVITYIPPQALRHRLRIPSTHLPLFASLCGTDYIPPSITTQFYEPHINSFQKIEKAARILREQLYSPNNASPQNRKGASNPGDQVVELVRKVVKKICVYPFDTEQSLQEVVDLIIEAALQYSLPFHVGDCCTNYPFCGETDSSLGCQTPISLGEDFPTGRSSGKGGVERGKEAYAIAQGLGMAGSIAHGWLYPDRMYQWQVLEDISGPCLKASEGAREIRRKAWGIADEGLGGLRYARTEEVREDRLGKMDVEVETEIDNKGGELESQNDKELRELLGVPTNDACSGIEVEGVQSEDTTLVEEDAPTPAPKIRPIREMVEYLRQGSTAKIIASPLTLPPASPVNPVDSPVCLKPLEERLKIYLDALHSNTEAIRSLPISLQPLVSLIRFCVIDASRRSYGKTDHNKWRREEVVAVLRAGIGTYTMWERELGSEEESISHKVKNEDEGGRLYPLLETRSANLIAQVGSVSSDVHLLAQALLLLPESVGTSHAGEQEQDRSSEKEGEGDREEKEKVGHGIGTTHLIPFIFISGVTLHSILSKIEPTQQGWKWTTEEQQLFDICWDALIDGITGYGQCIVGLNNSIPIMKDEADHPVSAEEVDEGGKKNRKKKRRKSPVSGGGTNVGRFGILEGMMD